MGKKSKRKARGEFSYFIHGKVNDNYFLKRAAVIYAGSTRTRARKSQWNKTSCKNIYDFSVMKSGDYGCSLHAEGVRVVCVW